MALFNSTSIARLMALFSSASIALCFAVGSVGSADSALTSTCASAYRATRIGVPGVCPGLSRLPISAATKIPMPRITTRKAVRVFIFRRVLTAYLIFRLAPAPVSARQYSQFGSTRLLKRPDNIIDSLFQRSHCPCQIFSLCVTFLLRFCLGTGNRK